MNLISRRKISAKSKLNAGTIATVYASVCVKCVCYKMAHVYLKPFCLSIGALAMLTDETKKIVFFLHVFSVFSAFVTTVGIVNISIQKDIDRITHDPQLKSRDDGRLLQTV